MKAWWGEQRTDEWFEIRCGKITGSNIGKVMAYLKRGGETKERWNYKVDLLCEQTTGVPIKHYVSPYMLRGVEDEPKAIREYERRTGDLVQPVGFVFHPSIEMAGCSPDGLLGDDGILSVKNLEPSNHVAAILDGTVPDEYYDQLQFELNCTERQYGIYLLHCEDQVARYRQFTIRVPRDEGRIAEIDDGVRLFLAEIKALKAELDMRCAPMPEDAAPTFSGDGYLTDEDFANLK